MRDATSPWYNRAFDVLRSETPLDPRRCANINGGIGLVLLLANGLGAVFAPDFLRPLAVSLAAIGLVLAAPWPYLRGSPTSPVAARVLGVQGLLFAGFPLLFLAGFALVALHPTPGPRRMGHAPGVLAFSEAYGLRLTADFAGGFKHLSRTRLADIGFIAGGVCDLAAVALIIVTFLGAR